MNQLLLSLPYNSCCWLGSKTSLRNNRETSKQILTTQSFRSLRQQCKRRWVVQGEGHGDAAIRGPGSSHLIALPASDASPSSASLTSINPFSSKQEGRRV